MIRSISRPQSLRGTVPLPGDKSISHRYAMLSAIAEGVSELRHFASSRDCHSTLRCLRSLGVEVREDGDTITITGRGLRGLQPCAGVLDAGNSGTTIRLLSGILAGHPFESTITGDESLSRRPMERILQPLRLMGAEVGSRERGLPPLKIRGGTLKGLRYELPIASAQVKSCVLLAGMYADAPAAVYETIPTRDHTELALRHFGASVETRDDWIEVQPSPRLVGRRLEIPGDISGAAFFLVAAGLVPGSELILQECGLNRRRRSVLDYLRKCNLDIAVEQEWEIAGEPRGTVRVRCSKTPFRQALPPIHGGLSAALIDEIPVLTVLGSQVDGGLLISDAGELRVKESDRIATVATNLRAMGATVEEKPDGLRIRGGQRLQGADILPHGDHRIAMAFAVAGLVADGETRIHEAECADVSFPGFWDILDSITG
jgi:3-phosphoshikimate 1-carboxyvinyltransferase